MGTNMARRLRKTWHHCVIHDLHRKRELEDFATYELNLPDNSCLARFAGWASDSGEGRWTMTAATAAAKANA